MSDPVNVVVQKCEYYLRIVTIFQVCVKRALLSILHDQQYGGLPLNQQQVHVLLLAFKNGPIGVQLTRKGILKDYQWDVICHQCTHTCAPNCKRAGRTDTEDLDTTSICVLLSNYLQGFPPPINGWKRPLASADYSKAACGIRARILRNNRIGHGSYHQLATQQDFADCYDEIEKMLKGLGYNNMQLFYDLKTSSLDPYLAERTKFLSAEQVMIKDRQNKLETKQLNLDSDQTNLETQQIKLKTRQKQLKAKQNQLEAQQNQLEAQQNIFKDKQNQIQSKQNQHESQQMKSDVRQNQFEVLQNRFDMQLKQFERNQNNSESRQNQLEERLDSDHDNINDQIKHLNESFERMQMEGARVVIDSKGNNSKLVSQKLKKKYEKKYGSIFLDLQPEEARRRAFTPKPTVKRKEIVVNLSLISSEDVFEWDDANEDSNGKSPESESLKFNYSNIFESSNDYILISGVPGCGKTTLVETILYQWSTGKLWQNEFDFVFIIYFRQLVKFKLDANTTGTGILSHFYPEFDFSNVPHNKCLLILDGFDEFASKEDFLKPPREFSPFVQAVYDLVDPNNPSIQFNRLMTSRPGSCSILFNGVFNETFEQDLRIFKIIGFDQINIRQYVRLHLQNENMTETLLKTMENNSVLSNFSKIPFFCWGICYLLKNQEFSVDHLPTTKTAIYANILTLFIWKHGFRNTKGKLKDLILKQEFQEMIMILSNMAWLMHIERKLIFTSKELSEFGSTDVLLQSGLVIKVELDTEENEYFQFMHYSFHEFFCAVHLFYSLKEINYDSVPHDIKKIIAGLCGGKLENSSSDLLVKSISTFRNSEFEFPSLFASGMILNIWSYGGLEFENDTVIELSPSRHSQFSIANAVSIHDNSRYLNYFEEFQNETKKIFINVFSLSSVYSFNDRIKLKNFINRCKKRYISINILRLTYMPSDPTLEKMTDVRLITHLLNCCTTLLCKVNHVRYLLTMNLDLLEIKRNGTWKHLHLIYNGDLEPAQFIDIIANLETVKVLLPTERIETTNCRDLMQLARHLTEVNVQPIFNYSLPRKITFYNFPAKGMNVEQALRASEKPSKLIKLAEFRK